MKNKKVFGIKKPRIKVNMKSDDIVKVIYRALVIMGTSKCAH